MRVTLLNCPKKLMNQLMSALASGPREMVPACSVARASKRRLKKVLAPVVHLVAWKSLPKKLWNYLTGMDPVASSSMQKILASSTLDGWWPWLALRCQRLLQSK